MVFVWINDVLLADGRQRLQMVNVDIVFCGTAICVAKVEPAYGATGSVVSDALLSSYGIALERADLNSKACALNKWSFNAQLFLERPRAATSNFKLPQSFDDRWTKA